MKLESKGRTSRSTAWEQRKFYDLIDLHSGRDYKHLNGGSVPVYGTGGLMTYVDEALSYKDDAIGIGRKGTIDQPYKLQAPFWTVDTLFYAIPRFETDLNFAYCCFLNVNWKARDESSGLPSLSKKLINTARVVTPALIEQRKIGAFFQQLDSLITLHQRKLDHLQQMKKGLLQQMFV